MANQTTAVSKTATTMDIDLANPFASVKAFETAQRIGQMLSQCAFTPDTYKGKIGDCVVALEMANRMGTSPFVIMQNMYVVNGKPSFSSKFAIGAFEACGKYGPITYETNVDDEADRNKWYCIAKTVRLATGEEVRGAKVTWQMVQSEGWDKKNGSKWNTIPSQMFRYRAASFMINTTEPGLLLGFRTDDEVIDGVGTFDVEAEVVEEQPKIAATAQPTATEQTAQAEQVADAKANLFGGVKL